MGIPGLGQRIRQARQYAGLTGAALATASGISRQALDNIETGRTPDPRVSHVVLMARALQIPLTALVNAPVPSPPPAPVASGWPVPPSRDPAAPGWPVLPRTP
jgi:transcriptional regulator with XRE-family HTH domain